MQLLGVGSDEPWINNDWHVRGTKWVEVFCGIWDKGAHNPRLEFSLLKRENTDHWGWQFCIWLWTFEFSVNFYDQRHWNHYRKKPITTEADQREFEADDKADDSCLEGLFDE